MVAISKQVCSYAEISLPVLRSCVVRRIVRLRFFARNSSRLIPTS